jgi:hypothetical protein
MSQKSLCLQTKPCIKYGCHAHIKAWVLIDPDTATFCIWESGSTKLSASRYESLQPVSFAESMFGCLHPDEHLIRWANWQVTKGCFWLKVLICYFWLWWASLPGAPTEHHLLSVWLWIMSLLQRHLWGLSCNNFIFQLACCSSNSSFSELNKVDIYIWVKPWLRLCATPWFSFNLEKDPPSPLTNFFVSTLQVFLFPEQMKPHLGLGFRV